MHHVTCDFWYLLPWGLVYKLPWGLLADVVKMSHLYHVIVNNHYDIAMPDLTFPWSCTLVSARPYKQTIKYKLAYVPDPLFFSGLPLWCMVSLMLLMIKQYLSCFHMEMYSSRKLDACSVLACSGSLCRLQSPLWDLHGQSRSIWRSSRQCCCHVQTNPMNRNLDTSYCMLRSFAQHLEVTHIWRTHMCVKWLLLTW